MNGVTIQDFWLRCKTLTEEGIGQFGLLLLLFLVAAAAFGLGRLSAFEDVKPPVSITEAPQTAAVLALPPGGGYVVASRTGSVYYLPWCAGAQKMDTAKQVWFPSEAAAQKAGYSPSKSCQGLGNGE